MGAGPDHIWSYRRLAAGLANDRHYDDRRRLDRAVLTGWGAHRRAAERRGRPGPGLL